SAVAVAVYKIASIEGQSIGDLGLYINSDKALAIISGILVSVAVAFTFGALIQYIARILFSLIISGASNISEEFSADLR
ncbi:MAG TPA: hypothetical protein P5550_09920, partial [Bacteroidales bacterium]|nr:hypothetical protein [Bacteroidales bacterium]